MLGASGVQIPENNLDDLQSIREEEDGTSDVLDPRVVLGSFLLAIIDLIILGLLLGPDLGLFVYTLVTTSFGSTIGVGLDSLGGTTLVKVNLVKGHVFPTIVRILPVEGFDQLVLVDEITHAEDNEGLSEDNEGLLESWFEEDLDISGMLSKDVTGTINLTFLSLFIGVTASILQLDLGISRHAPRAWYDLLSSFLLSNGFSKGTVDPTLFIRSEGKDILLVQIYVDDIIFVASTQELCDEFAKIIPRGIFINQSKYALESLKRHGMDLCDPVDTPMVEKSELDEDPEGKAVNPTHYRGMARPTEKHLHAIKRIFRYLRGTIDEVYFSFGRHLDELHVTWAHLEKKHTRLRTNTKTLEDLCSQSLETASPAIHDAVTTHQVTVSHLS
ncbi:retrovirus-related pol polyprotein from transposon TNT 1-94 [Tanacetum coccineum]